MEILQITKFSPEERIFGSTASEDDWIDASQIGETFDGKELTFDKYMEIENAYLKCISHFLDRLKFDRLKITFFVDSRRLSPKRVDRLGIDDPDLQVNSGDFVGRDQIESLSRLALRGLVGCRLQFDYIFVIDFPGDLYLLIGFPDELRWEESFFSSHGLFVEDASWRLTESDEFAGF